MKLTNKENGNALKKRYEEAFFIRKKPKDNLYFTIPFYVVWFVIILFSILFLSQITLAVDYSDTSAGYEFNNGANDGYNVNNLIAIGSASINSSVYKLGNGSFGQSSSGYYVKNSTSGIFTQTNDASSSFWFRTTTTGSPQLIFDYDYTGGTGRGLVVMWINPNLLRFSLYGVANDFTFTPTINTWYHIATVKDNTNYMLYVNGVNIQNKTLGTAASYNSTGRLRVGSDGTNYIQGNIDSLMLFDKAITASDVLDLYNSSNGKQLFSPDSDTGGNISDVGSYRIHTFSNNDTYMPSENREIEVLIVAGGGGSGNDLSGGGGGGGVIYNSSINVTAGVPYTVVVGQGGAGGTGTAGSGSRGSNGQNSVFDVYTAIGGGGGGSYSASSCAAASSGGSGGGACTDNSGDNVGASGTAGQGYSGGNSTGINAPPYWRAGGGGGANSSGQNYNATSGGDGGSGYSSAITGTTEEYGCGGGGGAYTGNTGGQGGCSNAGNGNAGTTASPGYDATDGYGGGGGGAGYCDNCGADGGDGIVIIRYSYSDIPLASERLQQDSSIQQNASVSINSVSYAPVMSSSITITDDTWLYGSATVPLNPTASNTATCRLTIDGAELNETETNRSLTAGSAGNMLITSLEHYVTAGAHNFGLDCKRTGGGAYTVDNASILLHILTTPDGTPLETAQLNITNATLPGLLASTTLTTSDNYTATGLERYFIMDFAANYEYTATGNISVITEVAGTNCTEVKRYGSSGSTGSVGGTCFVDLGNETNSTTYDIKVYGTGTGSVTNAKFHVKEFIIHEGEVNGTSLNGLTGDGAIATFNINVNAGHSTPDLVAQAILSVVSSSASTTGTFYINADGENSTFVSRTSNPGQPGVLGLHKDFETVSGTVPVTLYGDCPNCSFTGQNILAFVSSDVAATPNSFIVTATSSWDNSAINEFSINLSDGRSFTTTTGSIEVAGSGELYNITAVEQSGTAIPFFENSTLNHNSTYDLELNLTPYTEIYASGNATVNNFTVNGTSTTNGVLYFRLFNDTYNFTITDADDINGVEYANQNATLTASPYLRNYTFALSYSNTINISFYDEETGALINTTTVYFEYISTSQSDNLSTTTGNITESFLLPDTYTFRYNALGYADSFYYLTLEDRSFNSLNLTLLNLSSASNVTLNVFDTLGNKLEGAIVKILKFDVINNNYDVTEILQTNFEGVAIANIVLNSEYYKFIIDYDGLTVLTTNPTYIYGTDLTFYVPIGTQGMEDFFSEADISGQITYNYNTNLATFTYSDLDNTATQGCLYVYTRSGDTNTLVNSSCSSSSSGTLYGYAFNSSNNWVFEGKVTKGGEEYLISSYRVDFTPKLDESGSGAFFAFLLLAVVVFIGLFSLEVAIVLGSVVPLLFTITGLASFDYVVTIPIFVLGLVTAFIIGSNKT